MEALFSLSNPVYLRLFVAKFVNVSLFHISFMASLNLSFGVPRFLDLSQRWEYNSILGNLLVPIMWTTIGPFFKKDICH